MGVFLMCCIQPRAGAPLGSSEGDALVGQGKDFTCYSRQDKEPLQGVWQE